MDGPADALGLYARNPDGSVQRCAGDEDGFPASDFTLTTTLGGVEGQAGGFATADVSAWLLDDSAPELHRFAACQVLLPDRTVAWEGRIESTPERSAERALDVSLIGHAAILTDIANVVFLGVENDLASWIEPPASRVKDLATRGTPQSVNSAFSVSISEGGISIKMDTGDGTDGRNVSSHDSGEVWFRSPLPVAIAQYIADETNGANMAATIRSAAHGGTGTVNSATLNTDIALHTWTPGTPERFIFFQDIPTTGLHKVGRHVNIEAASLFGDHGLTRQAIDGTCDGLMFSDVLRYLIAAYAPQIATSEDGESTIGDSTTPAPRLAWLTPTTLRQVLDDGMAVEPHRAWAIWEGPTLHWHDKRSAGRLWRLHRADGATFVNSGATAEPDFNGAMVTYAGSDGIARWAGPVGSGADVEDASLSDPDPENPATLAGLNRYLTLQLDTTNDSKAVEIGALALEVALERHFSGEIEVPRYAECDGQMLPVSLMRAGDRVSDSDEAGAEEMLVVGTSYQRSSERPMTLTIEQPSNRLDAQIAGIAAKPHKVNVRRIRRERRHQRDMQRLRANRRSGASYIGSYKPPKPQHSGGGYGN